MGLQVVSTGAGWYNWTHCTLLRLHATARYLHVTAWYLHSTARHCTSLHATARLLHLLLHYWQCMAVVEEMVGSQLFKIRLARVLSDVLHLTPIGLELLYWNRTSS